MRRKDGAMRGEGALCDGVIRDAVERCYCDVAVRMCMTKTRLRLLRV